MYNDNVFFRIFALALVVVIALSIFILIVWRGSVMFDLSLKHITIFFVALGLLLLLMLGFFLSMSSLAIIQIIGLIFIGIIYVLWFLCPLLFVSDIVSFFYKVPPMIMMGASLLWLGFGFYYGTVHIQITPLMLTSNRITQDHNIVFISDLHVEAIHNRQYVQKIVNRIQDLQPDFVVIGGDLMNTANTSYVNALLPFNQLTVPVYATLGNHDHMGDADAIPAITQKTKIIVLRNESIDIGDLQLVGIDDKSYRSGKSLSVILKESGMVDTKKFTLLVSHQPQKLDKLIGYPIDLQLAGHTHNGQFFPLSLVIRFFNDYAYGTYRLGDMTAFVSQGIGSWGASFRLGTQREIVLVSLKHSNTQ